MSQIAAGASQFAMPVQPRLATDEQELIGRTRKLAEKFSARADRYDRTATFPTEDFDDILAAGLHEIGSRRIGSSATNRPRRPTARSSI